MTRLIIDPIVKLEFLKLNCDSIGMSIESYFNPDFVIENYGKQISFCFLKSNILLLENCNGLINHIYLKQYEDLITDEFLNDFLELKSLPIRIKRYKKIGIKRLRKQIADDFFIGEFITENNNVFWEKYNFQFIMSNDLNLKCKNDL